MANNFVRNLLIHIKYPYTALVISAMWISMAFIIGLQEHPQTELLVVLTAICSLIVAVVGFSSPKRS
ncbi:hypothetical protein FWF48_03505 [Candidatus Saccharibacteria bacterium]|nr:hypothetical protein [Candidatus Saccharibacteria bacterium]